MTIDGLLNALKAMLGDRGFEKIPSDTTLTLEIKHAINEINRCRRFIASDTVLYDPKYEDLIFSYCVINIAKYGAEGESSHSENGINRQYQNTNDVLSSIIPLAR